VLLETALLLDVERILVQRIAIVELQVLACVKEILTKLLEKWLFFL
jgi:hypothetical protein